MPPDAVEAVLNVFGAVAVAKNPIAVFRDRGRRQLPRCLNPLPCHPVAEMIPEQLHLPAIFLLNRGFFIIEFADLFQRRRGLGPRQVGQAGEFRNAGFLSHVFRTLDQLLAEPVPKGRLGRLQSDSLRAVLKDLQGRASFERRIEPSP